MVRAGAGDTERLPQEGEQSEPPAVKVQASPLLARSFAIVAVIVMGADPANTLWNLLEVMLTWMGPTMRNERTYCRVLSFTAVAIIDALPLEGTFAGGV
jgi:hypothetical protein